MAGKEQKSKPYLDRQISSYPHPKYYAMFIAEAYSSEESKSNMLEIILRNRYDNYTKSDQEKLLRQFDRLSPQEKKNPGKRAY